MARHVGSALLLVRPDRQHLADRPAERHWDERLSTHGAPGRRVSTRTKKQPYESGGKPLTIEEVLAILEENPRRIAALTAGLPRTRLQRTPVLGVWSVNEVLSHLRSVCDARGEFMRLMLSEPRPTLRANNPRTVQKDREYGEFAPSFRAFRRQRVSLLRFLKALPRRSWARTAIITGGGPPRERTVLFYAQWLAGHERAHVRHLTRALRVAPRPLFPPVSRGR